MVFTASSPAVAKLIWPFIGWGFCVYLPSTTTYLVGWNWGSLHWQHFAIDMLNFILVVSQHRYNSLVVTGPSDGISMPCKDLQEGHLADDRFVMVQQCNGHLETLCVKASKIVWIVIVGREFRQQETSEMFASTSPSFKPGNTPAFIFDSYHCPKKSKDYPLPCMSSPQESDRWGKRFFSRASFSLSSVFWAASL